MCLECLSEALLVTFTTLLLLGRSLLLAELEKEEKEKDWYYAQLQNLTKRIDSLPLTENVRVSLTASSLNAKLALMSIKKKKMPSQSLTESLADVVVVVV